MSNTAFENLDSLDVVGVLPRYASGCAAWKAKARRLADNAERHDVSVRPHRVLTPEDPAPQR